MIDAACSRNRGGKANGVVLVAAAVVEGDAAGRDDQMVLHIPATGGVVGWKGFHLAWCSSTTLH